MPRFRFGGGGGGSGGGAGLALGPETNEFTSIAARDNYATANADWLAEYDANTAFLVAVTISGTTTYYRRSGSAWETVTSIIKGGKGDSGADSTIETLFQATDGTTPTLNDTATGWSTDAGITDALPFLWRIERAGVAGSLPAWSTITPIVVGKIAGAKAFTGTRVAVGWVVSSDATDVTEAQLTATSDTESVTIPTNTANEYLAVWTPDALGALNFIRYGGSLVNSFQNYRSPVALSLNGEAGMVQVTLTLLVGNVIGGIVLHVGFE